MQDEQPVHRERPFFALLIASLLLALFGSVATSDQSGQARASAGDPARRPQEKLPPASNPGQKEPSRLSSEDRSEVAVVLKLKESSGDDVWPGLAEAYIPVLLYNTRFEFLVGLLAPPQGWTKVEGDDVDGRPCFRREAKEPQSFAVKIEDDWAGSISTLADMSARNPIKISPDFHAVMVLHEMFHAFQAVKAPARFERALDVYKAESPYPYEDKDFAGSWVKEGAALAAALRAPDMNEASRQAKRFIEIRDARRDIAHLDPSLLAFERELEWLEGLAEYAEIVFYKSAVANPPAASTIKFGPQLPFVLQWDFVRVEKQLGSEGKDNRFYVSGMAQAFLLDRLDPLWKSRTEIKDIYLEDLLRQAVL